MHTKRRDFILSDYLDMLAYFGVSGAHPGGMALTKAVLAKADIDPERPILDAALRHRPNRRLFRPASVFGDSS